MKADDDGNIINCFCSICKERTRDVKFLPLYVIGSEGIQICVSCRNTLTEVAKGMMLVASKAKMLGYKACKVVHNL